jgi:hypothetical protein
MQAPDRIIRLKTVIVRTGLSTLYRRIEDQSGGDQKARKVWRRGNGACLDLLEGHSSV